MATINRDFKIKNNLNLINTADTATAATHYFVETASDGAVRPKTLANVKSEIVTTAAVNSASVTVIGNATAAYITLAAQDGVSEGGEILFKGAGANADWNFDNYAGYLRFFTGGNVKLSIKSTDIASTVPIIVPAATATATSINIPHGTAPTAPNNGDLWTTTAGMYVRVNGATVGPLGTGGTTAEPLNPFLLSGM